MNRTVVLFLASALLLLTGLVHGLWADRWQPAPAVTDAAARVGRVPRTVGPWQGTALEFDSRQAAQARLAGHTWRRYENPLTGGSVGVLLVCGRSGPVAVHTPDVCYGGAGYTLLGRPVRQTVSSPAGPADFWTARFARNDSAVTSHLRIFWGWNAAGRWEAPDSPRLTFARYPALYKLYVTCETAGADDANEQRELDDCTDLLFHLLPAVGDTLSSP